MNLNDMLLFFSNQDLLLKIALIILISLYSVFALIVFIQIKNLNNIINQINFSPVFTSLSFFHFIAALALLFATVIFL